MRRISAVSNAIQLSSTEMRLSFQVGRVCRSAENVLNVEYSSDGGLRY